MAGILQYAMKLDTGAFTGPLKGASSALRGLGSSAASAAGMVAKLAAPIGALAGGVSIFQALSKAATMEQLNVSMEVLIGNAKEAAVVLGELKQFANVTPFNTQEVMTAGKNLIALGSSTKTLTAELRALGDVSAGMNVPLNDMVQIYGKARTQGTLFAQDLNQLARNGVPIFKALADVLGTNESEIKKLASEGQITFPMLQKVFSDLTAEGGKFFEMMQRQSGTTKGLLSTLKSALDELLITIGTPINDFLKPILSANIARMQALNQRVVAFLQLLSAARKDGKLGEFLGAGLKLAIIEGINTLAGGVRGVVAYLSTALPIIASEFKENLLAQDAILAFRKLFEGLGALIGTQILKAASKIRFTGVTDEDVTRGENTAANYFRSAKNLLEDADFAGGIDSAAKAMKAANDAGQRAFSDAIANPLIDSSIARLEFKNLARDIDPFALDELLNPSVQEVVKTTQTLEEALGGLNTAIKAAQPKPAKEPAGERFPVARPGKGAADAEGDAAPRRRGLLDAAASFAARMDRRAAADRDKAPPLGGMDDLAVENFERRQERFPGLKKAADQMARAGAAADPAQGRRARAAAEDPLLKIVRSIDDRFNRLAVA